MIRASLSAAELDGPGAGRTYKRLSTMERAHVLICMLAYDVEGHMRRKLRPMLFDDEEPGAAEGGPAPSFRTLLQDLTAVCRNTVAPRLPGAGPVDVITRPAPQEKAFKLLGVRLTCGQ